MPRAAIGGPRRARGWSIAVLGAGFLLAACGGSSSSGGGGGAAAGTLGGTAFKGPVAGATVTAFAVSNGTRGAPLGTATTDPQGRFTMSVGSYSGPMLVEARQGSYADEATGSTMPMMAGDVMSAAVPAYDAGTGMAGLEVTPLTSMAAARAQAMAGAMTAANMASANAAVGSYFTVTNILMIAPMDPLVPGSGSTATLDAKNYGMSIAAMSEYAKTIGMSASSSSMVTAMSDDASDGKLDGMMGSTPISMSGMAGMGGMMGGGNMQPTMGTTGLASAMSAFVQNPTVNRSGVTMSDMASLVAKLGSSDGTLE